MRIAIIGRTRMLLEAAYDAQKIGHEIVFVATAKESAEATASANDFEQLAERSGCPFFVGPRFGDEQIAALAAANSDIGLTMNWPSMIGEAVTSKFRWGVINAHGSDLPKYRGNACPNWAIINGDVRVGLTFHIIDPHGLDTGPIVCKYFMDINDDVYIGDVYDWLNIAVPRGFINAIEIISSGVAPMPQEGDVIRAYPRRPEDGRIVWGHDCLAIHRLIRASSHPFSGAFCYFSNKKIVIWRAKIIDLAHKILAIPGQVLWYNGNNPVVACGSGAIEIIDFSVDDGGELGKSLRARFN